MKIRKRDGFTGERSIVLPPMIIELEEKDPLASSLFITDIGYYPHAKHHYRSRQQPINQYVLIYCIDGQGWFQIGEQPQRQVKKNQYFILPAGLPHSYGADDEGWTIYWIHFRGLLADIYSRDAQEPRDINITLNSRVNNRNSIFDEILNTLEAGLGIENLRYASSLLHHYLASMRYLEQYRKSVKQTDEKTIVEAAIHFMKENLEKRITLQDVLRYVGYSPSHFSMLFKRATGMSTLSYFNQLKVEHACHLLAHTDMKVNQIGFKLGFHDSLYFSRLFSKTMGMSPRQYRDQSRHINNPNIQGF